MKRLFVGLTFGFGLLGVLAAPASATKPAVHACLGTDASTLARSAPGAVAVSNEPFIGGPNSQAGEQLGQGLQFLLSGQDDISSCYTGP
jgi:hypothetical protein